MDRATRTVLVLLLVALLLPSVAKLMQAAVTPLIGVLILLVGLRLFLPHRH